MSPTIEVGTKELFDKLDRKLDSIGDRFEQKLDAAITRIDQRLDTIGKDVVDLKVGQARLEENGKRLEDKIDGLGKRLDNQEFISRGVLIGLFVAVITGLAKMLGFIPGNP